MTAAKQMKSVLDVKRTGLTHNINEMKRAFELLARMVADKGVRVIFRGTTCATDHQTIFLPELALLERGGMTEKEVEESQQFLDAVRGFLFHEVAHILFTDRDVFEKGAKEDPKLLKHAMNAVEDVRIEKRMADQWRGAGVSLRLMNEWMLRKMQEQVANEPLIGKVIVGVAWVARTGQDHWFFKGLDDSTKALLKKFAPEIRAARNLEDTEEALALGRRIVKKLKEMGEGESKQPPQEPPSDGAEGGSGAEGEGEGQGKKQNGKGKGKGKGKGNQKDEEKGDDEEEADGSGSGSEGEGTEGGGEKAEGEAVEEGSEGEDAEDSGSAGEGDEDEAGLKDALDQLKNEFNSLDQTANTVEQMTDKARQLGSFVQPPGNNDKYLPYTTEFDVAEAAEARPLTEYHDMMVEGRKHFGIMKRNLANLLRARSNVMTIAELEEGDLDTTMLYRLAAGQSNKVFKEDFEHLDTNVGVVLLVNESGSMSAGVYGNGRYETRVGLAKVTAALLGEVLDSLGIPFAIYGHTTGVNAHEVFWSASEKDREIFTRWGSTRINIYKGFDESFGTTKCRIPSMAARNNTHDAEALIFAANQLILQKVIQRRIIITIDDGRPEPNMPGTSGWDAAKAQSCTATQAASRNVYAMSQKHQDYVREVVKTLAGMKVEILGMGMGTHDVKHFYDKWLAVDNVAAFPAIALKELRKLLIAK